MREKRYYSLNDFYRQKFGTKVFKISLDAGFSCPNKDGKKGFGGCTFCTSTPFIGDSKKDLKNQFEEIKKLLHTKWKKAKYIIYLEANSNTYATVEKLKEIYEPLIGYENVVGLNLGTRCDCIDDDILDYLENLNKRTFLTIELGLQSSFNETLKRINRGHTREEFAKTVKKLKEKNINVVAHIINGLPNETEEMMVETCKFLNKLDIDGIKIHMLYLEQGSKITEEYQNKKFHILTKDEYIKILGKELEVLNKNIVIHRLTSGPDRNKLIKPKWLNSKFTLLNEIEKYLEDNDIWQGQKRM